MKIIIATGNPNKIREIKDKMSGIAGLELLSLDEMDDAPEVIEDGATFRDNALKKAREISRHFTLPAMADDSGLVVDVLGGEPGVLSARYAGEGATDADRNRLLLSKMEGVSEKKRTARFVCVIALAFPDGKEFVAEGSCEGMIAEAPRGAHGFGYDPVFLLPERGKTMAELDLGEKNAISHRARALDGARGILASLV